MSSGLPDLGLLLPALSTTEQLSYRAAIESAEESLDNHQVDSAEFQNNREIAKLIADGSATMTEARFQEKIEC